MERHYRLDRGFLCLIPLKSDWQRHVLASSGYLELGMFDDAAMVLEEIAPEDKTRNEVLGARVNLYMAAKKWERYLDGSPDGLRRDCEESRKDLHVDCIDFYQLHWVDPDVPLSESALGLTRLQQEGKIRLIGPFQYHGQRLVSHSHCSSPHIPLGPFKVKNCSLITEGFYKRVSQGIRPPAKDRSASIHMSP